MSDRTASFLGEEFELEPGYGETRDDAIKAAGLKTFLIKTVLKQVSIYKCVFVNSASFHLLRHPCADASLFMYSIP